MESVAVPRRVEIEIDEPRVARGSVDPRSVRVKIEWREAASDHPLISALDAARAELPEPVDLTILKRRDGEVELVPASWKGLRIGEGPPFFDLARRTPGGLGVFPPAAEACAFATELIRRYLTDFDAYPPDEKAAFLMQTVNRLNEVSESIGHLEQHLQHAAPDRKPVPLIKDPERDVHAAVLKDVCGLTTIKIGEQLGIPLSNKSAVKGENHTVRKMVNERGRPLLERYFGPERWRAKAERMRASRSRWEAMEPEQKFYELLAEVRGTSAEEERRAALRDGFDATLNEWMDAWECGDLYRAVHLQLSDARFRALHRL
jgi:hypothetical protein